MRVLALPAFVIAVLASGCPGTVDYTATASTDAYYASPDLVYVAPGVQVIADWNEPIFYTDGFYWRYDGVSWYRSSFYTGGWVYAVPPMTVLRLNPPMTYRHYRPVGWTPHHVGHAPPPVRDHRSAPPPPPVHHAPPPPPARHGPPPPPPPARDGDHHERDHRRG